MTSKEKKAFAKSLVDELEGISGKELNRSIDELAQYYSPMHIGNDMELWGYIKDELREKEIDFHMISEIESKSLRMRDYKVRIRWSPNEYGTHEENIAVQALSKRHAFELASEKFAETIALKNNLSLEQWYIKRDNYENNG